MKKITQKPEKVRYYKSKYFIVFYSENDEDYVASFDNISDICRYKQLDVNQTNTQAVKNLLWVALHKEDHRTRMLNGKLMHVYLVDIYDDDEN